MSSAVPPTDSAQTASPVPKKKNNKKKKGNKPKPVETQQDGGQPEQDDASDDPDTPGANTTDQPNPPKSATISESNGNGHATGGLVNGHGSESDAPPGDTSAKLAAMTEEREALRSEVEKLRKQLETLQESQSTEVTQLQTDLEESEAAREQVQSQYDTLMGRVEKIKETTMTRLKKDKEELNEAKDRIEELETQIEDLQRGAQASDGDATRLREELQEATRELTSLRSRNNLSQQNWLKEKDDQARQMQHLRSELESTSTAMGEWEVIAMEERSVREGLAEKVADLEEQLTSLREAHDHATSELDTQARSTDRLQRALQEIQEARKRELREMVESSEEQLEAMKLRVQEADARAAAAETERAALAEELTRTAPFEKEVKEKSLLLGKLRHETIVLNDHLTRALKYIKKNRPEENVDREVVSNHFLHFLGLDRSDPRKFQILQVIAGLLHWTEEQREQAGLARPGTGSLRLPASPFHRTPSTPSLNTEFFSEPTPSASGRESLADLWADFLERSVEEAGVPGGPPAARRGSAASSVAGSVARPDTRGG